MEARDRTAAQGSPPWRSSIRVRSSRIRCTKAANIGSWLKACSVDAFAEDAGAADALGAYDATGADGAPEAAVAARGVELDEGVGEASRFAQPQHRPPDRSARGDP